MTAALATQDLLKDYPVTRGLRQLIRRPFTRERRRALDGLTLSVEHGERLALIGPNGAGKTTLVRIATGVVSPDSGRVQVLGSDPSSGHAWRAGVGFARPDDPALHPRLSVLENLRFWAELYGGRASKTELLASLETLEAGHLADRRVQTLSGGEKARAALARALLARPKLLILDELSRVLDPGAATRTRALLAEQARAGAAVLLVTHDLNEAALCDRVIVMRAGKVAAQGPWTDVEPVAREVFAL